MNDPTSYALVHNLSVGAVEAPGEPAGYRLTVDFDGQAFALTPVAARFLCERLGSGEGLVEQVARALSDAPDREEAYLRVQALLNRSPESPERHEAWRLASDRLQLVPGEGADRQ